MDVRAVLDDLDRGQACALATVVACAGSTPRHLGARMAVTADGQRGSIGGGRIEVEVTAAAREVAAGGPARRAVHHLVRDLGMCCGGKMTIAIGPAAASRAALAEIVRAADERRWVVVETPADGGPLVARAPIGDERHGLARPRADADRLVELCGPAPRAVVLGAGHVGRALGPMLAALGFEVVACDDGETGALAAPLPWAGRVIEAFEPAAIERALGPLGAGDHVFIVTRDHALDQRLLETLLGNDALSYLGLIGSRGKIARFEKRLRAKGLIDDARWARLHGPIGLDLGAETPAEIAVAIAAELVALRRGRAPGAWTGAGGGEAP
jgi:xanthine dehydrogenase accessory factor